MKYFSLILLVLSLPSVAQVRPLPLSHQDPSIQQYIFTEGESYTLPLSIERFTSVELREEITVISVDDEESYSTLITPDRKSFFVMPHTIDETTISVASSDHIYVFHVQIVADAPSNIRMEKAAPVAALISQKPQKQLPDSVANTFGARGLDAAAAEHLNTDYSYKGDALIAPSRAVDNGQFTIFEFAGDLPAVYVIGVDGKEMIVNSHVEGNLLVVHRTAQQFTLRLNHLRACVFNGAY